MSKWVSKKELHHLFLWLHYHISFMHLFIVKRAFVFVCVHAGWVYLRTAQTEMMMHVNMSSRERERGAKAKLKPTPATRRPSTRRGEKARRGTLLLDLFHLYFHSYAPLQVYYLWAPWQLWFYNSSWRLLSFCFLTCPHRFGKSIMRHLQDLAAKQMSVPLSVSLLFQMTVDQPHQLQIWKWYVWAKDDKS